MMTELLDRYTLDHEGLGARNKLLYTQITQVLETKKVIMLYIEDAFVFADRAGFTNGTYEGSRSF